VKEPALWSPGDRPLVAWYGDDFTGTLAVLEVLDSAGLPGVVFLREPSEAEKARFSGVAAVGHAGTARAETPGWMDEHLTPIYDRLDETGAEILAYKVCSTLDSSPETGSIGRAVEIAAHRFAQSSIPCLVAAPWMGRYQAFGSVYATGPDGAIHRLDRHPVMTRHPVTPMDEADIRLHLARQTDLSIHNRDMTRLDDAEMPWPDGLVGMDACTDDHMRAVGRLIWEGRRDRRFVFGSQGIQMALVLWWRAQGLLPEEPPRAQFGKRQTVVISGSVSPTTRDQIVHAQANGFVTKRLDAVALVASNETREAEIESSVAQAAEIAASGANPLLFTALGPDDPAVTAFNAHAEKSAGGRNACYRKLGDALGDCLSATLAATGLRRAVVAGGDTSGRIMDALDGYAVTPVIRFAPGSSLFRLHAGNSLDGIEIMLKGGQMGTSDIFTRVAEGRSD
jgi:3-oxoisoapionate kinase